MTTTCRLKKQQLRSIDGAVEHFRQNRHLFETFAQALLAYFQNDPSLMASIHTIKYRIKDADHLHRKLVRKALEGNLIDRSTLFDQVNDLAGVRLIHLHTEQMRDIHNAIKRIVEEEQIKFVEPPTANCWDIEYENFYREIGIAPRSRESMYTTVHYILQANKRTKVTCEVQVRTLMDEVWGEVSHRVNYPEESPSRSCKDQLKVLARLTSGCTRLVDAIFQSHREESGLTE